jgi:uncharacterized protein YbbK (DUF523 family)
MNTRIRIGISSCLLGSTVRYDGGHKHNEHIVATLGKQFDFVPFCPEVAIGLGVPRAPLHLVQDTRGTRARGIADPAFDVTDRLAAYAEKVATELHDVSGYIFKARSPSCGTERVPVHDANGTPVAAGAGIYAAALMVLLPELPFEEEGRLLDPVNTRNFIERVFVYHRQSGARAPEKP